jgi:hypothetical protein
MKHFIRILSCLAILALVAGCASIHSTQAPDADLSRLHTFYVQKLPADDNGIEKMISDRLVAMGFKSSYGTGENPPTPVDAIVTYEDKWMWDITMYLIRLTVQVREPESRSILASAESYRPSLERKSPEQMVEEVLNEIFKKDQKK